MPVGRQGDDTWFEKLAYKTLRENRHKDNAIAERDAYDEANSMPSMSGGSTRRGRSGASEKLTRGERKAADRILREGKPKKKGR